MADDAESSDPTDDSLPPAPRPRATFPTDDGSLPTSAADGGSAQTLYRFLSLSPFLDLYDRSGTGHKAAFGVCFSLDVLFRLVAATFTVAIIVAVAWKTLAPLPGLDG